MQGAWGTATVDRTGTSEPREEAPAASLWLRHVRSWLETLSYRPERRYMRGEKDTAPAIRG
ncbi:hypothetical protein DFH01_08910 [Falsiroseomonas bella]|uniref:Uncharacterized protein n=1 Tax=Falsiroseomonas bella TaxID=2184016 RepID=A0A317FD17_9PROT|nr:hypothetical protein [Falsiroseomonas bella]PWS36990.1 hypothetical protein DFH01_08910 [Falsiroseomonas bella]